MYQPLADSLEIDSELHVPGQLHVQSFFKCCWLLGVKISIMTLLVTKCTMYTSMYRMRIHMCLIVIVYTDYRLLYTIYRHTQITGHFGDIEVARRPTYKGAASSKCSLPLDATTVLGMIAVLGSILPATGLKQDAVQTCTSTLDALASFGTMNATVPLLPESHADLPVENNRVEVAKLNSLFSRLDLSPQRPTV